MASLKTLFILFLTFCLLIKADWINLEKRIPQAIGQQPGTPAPGNSGAPQQSGSSAAPPPQQSGSGQPQSQPQPQPSGNNTVAPPTNNNGTAPAGNNTANPVAGLPTSASYGVTVQVGMANFVSPTPSKSVSPLYRVDPKENVTFVWTYTNLLVRPANLTLAAVGPQSATYTIASLNGDATSYVWQLNTFLPTSPLMNGYYQIQLYDQRGPTAPPSPGWLLANSRLTIAFYSPESYQSIGNSNYCPTCFYSAGKTLTSSFGPLGVAFGIALVTSGLFIYGLIY
ncbi:hypothetical protein BJ944DRAFT_269437 [Cunninghamella echinulata]|nr:hypothetical protein BJ944DRAFT_269437 [Cunninghamella echinulata]